MNSSTTTLEGAGIWLRLGSMPPVEECIEHLDYVIAPLHSGERGMIHLGPQTRGWLETFQAAGGDVWAMDWLPEPNDSAYPHLVALYELAVRFGCVGVMGDHEPDVGWRGRPKAARLYRALSAALAAQHNLETAVTDYASSGIGDATLRELLAEVNGARPAGAPQGYDPAAKYAPDYHGDYVRRWQRLGATPVVCGVGAWLRSQKRHRRPSEFRRHLEHIPEDTVGVCAWYANAEPLRHLLPILGEHRAREGQRDTLPAPDGADPELARARTEVLSAATRLKPSHPAKAAELARAAEELLR